ncbi:MAG TPA: NAD(+)/NADH kinase [Fimbriimonadaceae bacterium]
MRVHLLVNAHRLDAVAAAKDTVRWLQGRKVEIAADPESAGILGVESRPLRSLCHSDLIICFGGDGTLIRAADICSELGTPILGVYYGRFGFVTQCDPHEIGSCLSEFMDGKATFEERMMLQTDLLRAGQVIASLHTLNEMALQRAITTRMLVFSVEVDGRHLTSYPADGVMVSTPTGSTAYNLSAGGPIMDPGVQALILTAIAPHTLSARPLILRPDSEVKLTVQTEGDAVLSADGQTRLHLLSGDLVRVTRSPRVTRLMCVDPYDFLRKLAQRLFWSFSIMGDEPPGG